ncbi:MAG: hypothetical protein HXY37_19385 [Chloroflexi bacterium]|nr:hypothetical protein [Chloroflexota bacterium]
MKNISKEAPSTVGRGTEMEYSSLRAEILKRIEMRQQIVSVTLTLAGIFLGVGLATELVALIYPPLAMFLAFGWAQNDFRIRDLARYIRERIEGSMPGTGYETYVQEQRGKNRGLGSWRFVVLSHGGVFLLTQLMAMGIGLARFTFDPVGWVLIGIDVLTAVAVVWLMFQAGRYKTGSYR